MLGLVLEGGGAKGAFQAGAIRALLEHNYQFDGVAGTSVGALNGAMVAQGEFEKSIEIWENMEFSRLFDFEDMYAEKIAKLKLDTDTVKYFFSKLKDAIVNKGLDTTRIKQLMQKYVDEDKIRKSKIRYGLVTLSLTDFKPYELFIDSIPQGKLCDFIMASANFPGFRKCVIDNKTYVDGGLYDNLPINMMARAGYKDIIAITTGRGLARKAKVKFDDLNITYINPSVKPGTFLNFNNYSVANSLKVGYFDGLRAIHNYKGKMTYIKHFDEHKFEDSLLSMPDSFFEEMCIDLEQPFYASKVINLVNISSALTKMLKANYAECVADVFIALTENVALKNNFDRLQLLTFENLVKKTHDSYAKDLSRRTNFKKSMPEKAFEIFYKFYR